MNKIEMLDKLMDIEQQYEDECKNIVEEKVYRKMDELYGGDGVRICNIYYSKQDNEPAQEECDDCAEKAKLLIDMIGKSTTLTESLTDSNVEFTVKKIDNNFFNDINTFVEKVKKTCIEKDITLNDKLLENVVFRILFDYFQTKTKQ